ncbi:MAG: TlpA disulfide reductase family protein [Thiohalospira sp.]
MLQKIRIFLLFIFISLMSYSNYAQKYNVYNFDSFSQLLKKQNDTTYVINFWATWCRPCVKEMPAFNQLNEKYKDKKVKIILVSLDFGKDLQSKIERFAETHDVKSTIVILDDPDSNSWINKVSEEWSGAIPATLIYNQYNRSFYEQSFTYEELESALNQFIKK